MMGYVNGFVIAVPTENREAYRQHALSVWPIFKENGALQLVECWGDDVPDGEVTSFPLAVKKKPDETIVFAWILWPSKDVRDKGMQAVREHPSLNVPMDIPFDGRRMIFGGFEVIVDE